MSQYLEIIKKIHSSPYRFVLVSSGGGTNAISEFLKVPGASKSVLESYVPYAKESLDYYLLKQPDHYCSLRTTLSMAAKAYSAAKKIDQNTNPKNLLGVAVTASLATNYSKKGEHKFFIAIQTYKYSSSFSFTFPKKGELTREEEELIAQRFRTPDYRVVPWDGATHRLCGPAGWLPRSSTVVLPLSLQDACFRRRWHPQGLDLPFRREPPARKIAPKCLFHRRGLHRRHIAVLGHPKPASIHWRSSGQFAQIRRCLEDLGTASIGPRAVQSGRPSGRLARTTFVVGALGHETTFPPVHGHSWRVQGRQSEEPGFASPDP